MLKFSYFLYWTNKKYVQILDLYYKSVHWTGMQHSTVLSNSKMPSNAIEQQILYTVCPRSSYPFHIVSYYVKWGTTSWAYSTRNTISPRPVPFLTSTSSRDLRRLDLRTTNQLNLFRLFDLYFSDNLKSFWGCGRGGGDKLSHATQK